MAERLFAGEAPTTSLDANDNEPYSLGTTFTTAVNGTVTHILWYFPASPMGSAVQGAVFNTTTGALITGTSVTFPTPGTTGAWNQVALTTPVALTAGVSYTVAIWTPGRYVVTSGYPWPKTTANLDSGAIAGKFVSTPSPPPIRPAGQFGGSNYFVDLWFEPAGTSVTPSTVTATASIPTVVVTTPATSPAPATVAAVATVPTVTVTAIARAQPATVAAVAAVPAVAAGRAMVFSTAGTSAQATGLVPGGNYVARVRARDAAGNWSAWSSPVPFSTPSSGPAQPATIAATASVPSATIGGTPPTVTAGRARPVANGQGVALDVTATPPGGATITGYSWSIVSGGGSLTNANTATPTYTAPGSGNGLAVVRAAVMTNNAGRATADVTVSYHGTVVAAENALTGTARATWDLASPNLGGISTLQGFCDGFTIDKTGTANFKIGQSDGAGWTAEVFRLGYYGGDGARSYGTVTPSGGQVTASQAQPSPGDADASTTRLSADAGNWSTTLTWSPPSWAPSGIYILRLNRTGGGASHVMFIVRDDARQADLMLMPADSTWNAYNAWGGLGGSMYSGNSLYYGINVDQYNGDAARFVSYNRPVVNRGGADSGRDYGAVEWSNFFTGEYPMLRFVERNGIDVKYYGCIDAAGDSAGTHLIGNGTTRGGVSVAMFVGHNEYWSDGMRAGWEAGRDAGVSLFSCAGNEVFWRLVGVDTDSDGRPRTWECFKSTISSRGSTGRPNWTGTWRDPDGAGKGGNNPENSFTGTIFTVNGPNLKSLVVPFNGGYASQPIWRHTTVAALTSGQSFTSPNQVLGFEWDTYGPAGTDSASGGSFMAAPHPRTRYCSDVTYAISGDLLTDAGDVYGSGNATHRLVVYPGGNGSMVFGTGTINWALAVDDANTYQMGNDNTSAVIQQATINMLVDMGAPPAALMGTLTLPSQIDWYVDVALTTVATTAAIPAVGVRTAPAPSTVTATAAVPAPTVTISSAVAATTVVAAAAVPAVATSATSNAVVTLSAVTATAAVPAVATTAGISASVAPSLVAAVAQIPAPGLKTSAVIAVQTVTAQASVPTPAPSAGGGTTVLLTMVQAQAAISTPAITAVSSTAVAAQTIPATAAIPAPSVSASARPIITSVAAITSMAAVAVTSQGGAGISLGALAAQAAIPAVAVRAGSSVALQTAQATASVPAVTVRISIRLATVPATSFVWQPAITTSSRVSTSTVAATATVPLPQLTQIPVVRPYPHSVTVRRPLQSITVTRRV